MNDDRPQWAPPAPLRAWGRLHAPVLTAGAIAAAWAGLALRHPTITYHLAPMLIAASWPLSARATRGRSTVTVGLRAAAPGLFLALAATTGLRALDALRGPALVGGSAGTEAALGAIVGAAWGTRAITRHRPGLLMRALGIAAVELEPTNPPGGPRR